MIAFARTPVQHGAWVLDQKRPGWHNQIDLIRLNMSNCVDCICGQLGIGNRVSNMNTALGFCLKERDMGFGDPSKSVNWNRLRDQWIEEIDKRLGVPTH